MASISAPGVGSGLDVSSIVSSLMAVERRPLNLLQAEASKINTKVSAWGKIQSQLAALQDSTRDLLRNDTFTVAKATSSDPTKVKVTAQAGAVTGNYEISVSALAQKQTLASASIASPTTVVGGGSLTITFGTISGSVFTPNSSGSTNSINIAIPANSTLEQVRDAINSAAGGVSASIITDTTGSRLALRGSETGATRAFEVSVTDDDGTNTDASGLSQLAYSASTPSSMTRTQTAANANLTIDGLAITSASNTLNGAVNGLTIDLLGVTTTPVAISATSDTETIKQSLQDFVDAYNNINKTLADQVKYDAAAKRGGPLQGDRSATQLQSQLREMIRTTVGGSIARLSDLGIEVQRDNSLKIKDSKLDAALATPQNLQAFFMRNDTAQPSNSGLARKLDQKLTEWLGTNGTVTGATSTLTQRTKANQDQQDAISRRLESVQKNLLRTYTALDQRLTEMRSTPIPSGNTISNQS